MKIAYFYFGIGEVSLAIYAYIGRANFK